MQMLKLIWFSFQQMSRMGLAQAGAEMTGGDILRARADTHRELHRQAGMAIRAKVYQGAASALEAARDAAPERGRAKAQSGRS